MSMLDIRKDYNRHYLRRRLEIKRELYAMLFKLWLMYTLLRVMFWVDYDLAHKITGKDLSSEGREQRRQREANCKQIVNNLDSGLTD